MQINCMYPTFVEWLVIRRLATTTRTGCLRCNLAVIAVSLFSSAGDWQYTIECHSLQIAAR